MEYILLFSLFFIFILCYYNLYHRKRIIHRDPLILKIKHDVSKLDPRIDELEFYASDESFTEDKRKIFLCLKDENGNYYDYNMLMYVAIHECSHALTEVIDIHHVTPEFRGMFEYLLQKATRLGIYEPDKPLIENYCGISLHGKKLQR